MREILPHIRIGEDADGRVLLAVEDLELFDVIEEHLRAHYLVFEAVQTARRPGGEVVTGVLPPGRGGALEAALALLDAAMVEGIYRLNNA